MYLLQSVSGFLNSSSFKVPKSLLPILYQLRFKVLPKLYTLKRPPTPRHWRLLSECSFSLLARTSRVLPMLYMLSSDYHRPPRFPAQTPVPVSSLSFGMAWHGYGPLELLEATVPHRTPTSLCSPTFLHRDGRLKCSDSQPS